MRYIIFIVTLFIFGYGETIPNFKSCVIQDTENQSVLYNKWFKQWGEWDFKKAYQVSNNVGNKEYSFQTNWTILDMIAQDDILGLECLYQKLKSDREHSIEFFNGIASPSVSFEQQCIDKASQKTLVFLLKNKVININATIDDEESKEELSLLQYATQKLHKAQIKKDTKEIQDYQKIIELLKKYGAK